MKRQNSDVADLKNARAGRNNAKISKTSLIESLECPVCHDVPRAGFGAGPIYGCKNGHIVCQRCIKQITQCPTCREKEIQSRNIFAERYIETELKDYSYNCKFTSCKVKLPMTGGKIIKHEKFCPQREVPCPKLVCKWKGPFSNLQIHLEDKKCHTLVQVKDADPLIFKFNLQTFSKETGSIFEKSKFCIPMTLLSESIMNVWCYVLINRDSTGLWKLMVYSMLPKDSVDGITAKFLFENATVTRIFETKVLSFETTETEAIERGQYMCLQDAQMKTFQIKG